MLTSTATQLIQHVSHDSSVIDRSDDNLRARWVSYRISIIASASLPTAHTSFQPR
jgi:hypothetical protein